MGSFNANILPASSGLSLGNYNRKWIGYLSSAFADSLNSSSSNAALSGTIRLASLDVINWRNAANDADLSLSKTSIAQTTTPADTLRWGGPGILGPFLSHGVSPAEAGEVRLASGDQLMFRDSADSADVIGLKHNSDDSVTVGGSGGITASSISAQSVTVSGAVTAADVTLAGTLTTTDIEAPSGNSGSSLAIAAGSGTIGAAGSVSITTGNSSTQVGGGNLTLNCGSGSAVRGKLSTNTYVSKYDDIATTGMGLAPQYATIDLTAQTDAITTDTLYSVPATGGGQYRLSWNAKTTTAAGTSSTLGALTIVYTDPDGVVVTLTCGAMIAAGSIATTSAANTTGTVLIGLPLLLNAKSGTDITYAFAYASNASNVMTYNLHLKLEYLG